MWPPGIARCGTFPSTFLTARPLPSGTFRASSVGTLNPCGYGSDTFPVTARWLTLVSLTVMGIAVAACSSTPDAIRAPTCNMLSPAQARSVLLSPIVHVNTNRAGYCAETGTGEGTRITRLTIRIYKGTNARSLPRGTGVHFGPYGPNPIPYSPGKFVEGYWISLTPPPLSTLPPGSTGSGILSAAKDGYIVRAWVTDSPIAEASATNALGLVLAGT